MNIIEDDLKDILIQDLFVEMTKDKILPSLHLRRDLGVDSLGFVELRTQIEQRFGVRITDDEFTPENFSTLSTLASLIEQHRSAG